jgi:hypothetical protein
MAPFLSDAAIGHLVLLVTTLAGIAIQVYRENRARRWALEDRRLAAAQRAHLEQKLDENTEISREAFREANDVNRKIAEIGEANQTAVLDVQRALGALQQRVPSGIVRNTDLTAIVQQRSADPEVPPVDRRRTATVVKVERRMVE